ncbi:protein tyrosine phosphatase [Chlorobaculum parvum NCIB 8327]|uniref:Protein tyrosine phosphatase n=1 Tax=Chlorobaculum parvum (strain DSM 263 / NCIMB 8327) TaxID=517417 RepID=B3QLI2_CHLP8|nr:arsenate reductase ArsC [Chlorobaculum parvum]ACF10872.1 protein tyrosine phosphatase [Chlorobaculum parvum NCIB 8327]
MSNQSILILCTGNSCRSQMAEGFLKAYDPSLEVHSAGTRPSEMVHPLAVQVMKEVGIDLSSHRPKSLNAFLDRPFDYVITVCDNAKESCPIFTGKVGQRLHLGFDDPAEATGSEQEVLAVFRRVRDEIAARFRQFFDENLRRG